MKAKARKEERQEIFRDLNNLVNNAMELRQYLSEIYSKEEYQANRIKATGGNPEPGGNH